MDRLKWCGRCPPGVDLIAIAANAVIYSRATPFPGALALGRDLRVLALRRRTVVMGDSHAGMWVQTLRQIAETAGWQFTYLIKCGCSSADILLPRRRERHARFMPDAAGREHPGHRRRR